MGSNGRECRVIGFMGLEVPIFARGISRGMFSGLIYRLANSIPNQHPGADPRQQTEKFEWTLTPTSEESSLS